MKKWKHFCCLFMCAFLFFCSCACGKTQAPNDSVTDTSAETQTDLFVRYKGELYTPWLYDGVLLGAQFDTCKTVRAAKQKAVCVRADEPDKDVAQTLVHEFKADPQCDYLLEDGETGERLLRKTTLDIPDYRNPQAKVSRIVWSTSWSDDKAYSPKSLLVWDDAQTVTTFMQFVCGTAGDPDAAQTLPADRTREDGKICFLEFEGVDGRLSIGYSAVSTDGKHCMYFSDFPSEETYTDTYGVVPLPDALQVDSFWQS